MCVGVFGLGVLRLEVLWLGVVVYGHPDPTLVVSLSVVPSARCPLQSLLISVGNLSMGFALGSIVFGMCCCHQKVLLAL